MVWINKAAARCVLAGLVMAGFGTTAWADTLVVRATGPSAGAYRPGSKLAEGGTIALKAGDMVTLLDAKGTRTLRGPGSFGVTAPAGAAQGNGVMLSALLDTKRVRRARTGAVRGNVDDMPAAPPRRPNLWMVDIAQSGPFCVADPAAVRLWRADAAKPATVRISGGGVDARATFAAGASEAAWPAALPVREGAAYRVSDGERSAEMRFTLLGDAAALDGVAEGLIAHQCTGQLDLLVDMAALGEPQAR
ncbi:hypothetical protein SAMN02927924_03571 [Sphingobium faniae]|nr:hypothetical protein SAMN02927924_03571 [Sphingobium faniae]